ncbi:hypothetical protein C499_14290 [Halogeometricum borinquense DSM 11551]|uniref:C2H2-type domain-containing protein n=1 Tax=Halogeometricum borinquense (strain ATCC 700274 / DSM 11551 / JCM 10706 / KCTC 4070 / PR3) TaxID=469382 RepID=E4NUQ8_HALBP|nr:hypothetical protein [Halogeometricum borinquense]ADQ68778.1 hypothetical protein Hbor_32470 [Halogeometricum borinquense DSM 11551]ELY25659.1 hypothetical protein C499_14290 [Halogeometricum borinquense DSM 11551]
MATDPFELIARLLGIDADKLRRLAAENDQKLDLDALSNHLDIDPTRLSDLQELSDGDDVEWDVAFDIDVSQIDREAESPRQSRRGVGIRPTRRRSGTNRSRSRQQKSERWTCPTCERKFLSHQALQRHYGTNPEHPQRILDVPDSELDQDERGWIGTQWIEFDDRVETFLTLPDKIEADDIEVTHSPSDECVEISGEYEETIDTNSITDLLSDTLEWRMSGRDLILSFPIQDPTSDEDA